MILQQIPAHPDIIESLKASGIEYTVERNDEIIAYDFETEWKHENSISVEFETDASRRRVFEALGRAGYICYNRLAPRRTFTVSSITGDAIVIMELSVDEYMIQYQVQKLAKMYSDREILIGVDGVLAFVRQIEITEKYLLPVT